MSLSSCFAGKGFTIEVGKTVMNMQAGGGGQLLGDEPVWHETSAEQKGVDKFLF